MGETRDIVQEKIKVNIAISQGFLEWFASGREFFYDKRK